MNFQDIIREVYDSTNNALKTNLVSGTITASSQVTVTPQLAWPDPKAYVGLVTATLAGSVNTGMNTIFPGPNQIGSVTISNAPTVYVGNPTLFAVVNTGAVGVTNSLTTLNPGPSQIGSVTVSNPVQLNTGTNWVGLATVWTANAQANSGNVTLNPSPNFIGLVTVANSPTLGTGANWIGLATVTTANAQTNTGNVTLNPSPNYIGLVSVSHAAWADPKTYIGLVTATMSGSVNTGMTTIFPGPNFIGLTTSVIGNSPILSNGTSYIGLITVANAITIGNAMVTVTLGTKLDSTNDSVDLKSGATVFVGNPTLYAVVNTGAVGNTNSLATLYAGPNQIGSVTVSNPVQLATGANWIGLVTIAGSLAAAAGNVTLDAGSKTQIVGNVTLTDSKGFIGLATVVSGQAWPDPKGYIGLVTITGSLAAASGNVTLDPGSKTGIVGNVTLSDSKTYIGLVTANISNATLMASVGAWGNTAGDGSGTVKALLVDDDGNLQIDVANTPNVGITGNVTLSDSKTYIGLVSVSHAAWADPKTYIGLVTATLAGSVNTGMTTLFPGPNYIGLVSANIGGIAAGANYIGLASVNVGGIAAGANYIGLASVNVGGIAAGANYVGLASVNIGGTLPALTAGAAYIGLVSVGGGLLGIQGNVTLSDSKGFIGLATTVNGAGTQFIGLVTAWSRNAGTTKTLIHKNIEMYGASIATIAVPSNTFKITHLLVNSDATVRVSLKSGATYLTGNASIGVQLLPGGGWVETGTPDSPTYIGLAGAAAIVVEKYESGVTAKIGGKIIYFDE